MVDKKALLALGAGAVALTQMGGAAGKQQEEQGQSVPAGGIGVPGLGGYSPNIGGKPAGPSINFEAPTVEAREPAEPNFRYTPNSGGGSKSKSSTKDKKSQSNNVEVQTDTSGGGSSDIEIASKDERNDTGIEAADTVGVQSTEPDQVTQELNAQTGTKHRTQTTAEMRNEPEHQGPDSPFSQTPSDLTEGSGSSGQKSKPSTKDKKGGGGIVDQAEDVVDDAAGGVQNFVDNTLGWGDV
jgi:hypothetical protein